MTDLTTCTHRELKGQWAVVTGASKGIGEAIAQRFAGAGANVVMVARGRESLEEAATGVRARARADASQRVLTVVADVAQRESLDALFDFVAAETPALNIFVANAGTGYVTPFLDCTPEEWDEIVALNFTGTIYGCQLAARLMARHPTDNAAILVVSSIRATGARAGRLVYSATKAAVNQSVRVAALELAPHGVRINAVSPGITETPLAARNPAAFDEAVRNVPLGRAAAPLDLAEASYFLCSPAARFITGVNLAVDGGESLSS